MKPFYLNMPAFLVGSAVWISAGANISFAEKSHEYEPNYVELSWKSDSSQIISLLHPFTFVDYSVAKNSYFHGFDPSKWINLDQSQLSPGDGSSMSDIKMLAVGGGLTAGVQNGGLFRAGQLSAYPNLVAKQIGIKNFVTPAFEIGEENGTGFLALKDDDSEFPNFDFIQSKIVGADRIQEDPPLFKPFSQPINNLAAPGLSVDGFSSKWSPWMKQSVVNLTTGKSWPRFMPFVWRLSNPAFFETSNLTDLINSKDFNFFLLEDLHERFLHVLRTRDQIGLSDLIGDLQTGHDLGLKSIQLLRGKGRRGAIFTIPDFRNLAGYNWYTPNYLKENSSELDISVMHQSGSIDIVDPDKPFWLMPTSKTDSCYRNMSIGSPFKMLFADRDILTVDELNQYETGLRLYNEKIRAWAKEFNLALVDIEDIYNRIHKSEYQTADGFVVDGSIRGNFFSFDGIYPSTIGQAIIANEVLHSINQTYKTNYELINITEYKKAVSVKL